MNDRIVVKLFHTHFLVVFFRAMSEPDHLKSYMEIEKQLLDLTPDNMEELADYLQTELAEKSMAASTARAFHLAISYRPRLISVYLELLCQPKYAAVFEPLRVALLGNLFHYLEAKTAYPSECGSLSLLYHGWGSLYSDQELLTAIRRFHQCPKLSMLSHLWVFAYFAPLIWRNDPDMFEAVVVLYQDSAPALDRHLVAFASFYDRVEEFKANDWADHRALVEQQGTIAAILRADDETQLLEQLAFPTFKTSDRVSASLFEPCWFCRDEPTLLQYATYHDAEKCFHILRLETEGTISDLRNKTLAQFAVASGSIRMVKHVQDLQCSFTDCLHVAAGYFHSDLFFYMHAEISHDLTAESASFGTVAFSAASSGNLYILMYCLDLGVDVNAADSRQVTPLHSACYLGQIEMVQFLLSRPGIDVNCLTVDVLFGLSKFALLLYHSPHVGSAKWPFHDDSAPARTSNDRSQSAQCCCLFWIHQFTALHLACRGGHIHTFRVLLSHPEIDVNLRSVRILLIMTFFICLALSHFHRSAGRTDRDSRNARE
jgi:ankyrin repeat protein